MVSVWRIGTECKMQQLWGVFYRCEEYAWLLHEIWLRAYFSHTWEILVWNPWRIGTNSSRAVRNWYQFFTAWNLRSVKFTVLFFFFFWFGFYGPFKNISLISSRSFTEGGRKPENPEKNHLTIRKQNLAFPHMTRARLEPQRWET